MEPEDLLEILRERGDELKRSSTSIDRKKIIETYIEIRDKILDGRLIYPSWVPFGHRLNKREKRDHEPKNFYNKLSNIWEASSLGVQPIEYYDWRPSYTYYTNVSRNAGIPHKFRRGIYSLFLSEYANYVVKDLQNKIEEQYPKIIPFEYIRLHREASKNRSKRILIKTGKYLDSFKVSYGTRKITITVEHQVHPENRNITFLQLSRMLEFGTFKMPSYAHWRKILNLHKQGESVKYMKTFLHMFVDIDRNLL